MVELPHQNHQYCSAPEIKIKASVVLAVWIHKPMKAREPIMKYLSKFPWKIMARVFENVKPILKKYLITFTPLTTSLYLAMTFDTIWGSLMLLSLPHPLKLQINKHLFKDLCFLEQFNLVYVTDACIKAFKPYPW